MARSRSGIRSLQKKKRKPKKTFAQKAAKVRLFTSLPFNNRTNFDPAQRRIVKKEYDKYKYYNKRMLHKVNKRTRTTLAEKGYKTTERGVILDAPRTPLGQRLKGARVTVLKGGVVKESVGDRRDYIIGLTKEQRRQFAKDPKKTIAALLSKSKSKQLRSTKKQYIRLQWGAYSGRIDYKLENLGDYFLDEKGNLKGHLLKNLTGIRIITYTEKKRRRIVKKVKGAKTHYGTRKRDNV